MKDEDIQGLITRLCGDDPDECDGAVEELKKIDGRVIPPLLEALDTDNKSSRIMIIWTFGEMGSEEAVDPLIHLLKDEDGEVREEAVRALGKIGDEKAVDRILPLLSEENWQLRVAAAIALGEMASPASTEPLIRSLEDDEELVRQEAILALETIGGPRALKAIAGSLKDGSRRVREHSAHALERMGWEAPDDDAKARQLVGLERWDEAGRLGEVAIEPLIMTLEDCDVVEMREIIDILTGFGERAARHLSEFVLRISKGSEMDQDPKMGRLLVLLKDYLEKGEMDIDEVRAHIERE